MGFRWRRQELKTWKRSRKFTILWVRALQISPRLTWALRTSCSILSQVSQSNKLLAGSHGATLTKVSQVLIAWLSESSRPLLRRRTLRDSREGSGLEEECPVFYGITLTHSPISSSAKFLFPHMGHQLLLFSNKKAGGQAGPACYPRG